MTTMYTLLSRVDDISWEQIGYSCVEVREEGSARVLYRAKRPPIVLGSKPRR